MSEAEEQVQVTTGVGEGRQRPRHRTRPSRGGGLLRPWRIPCGPKARLGLRPTLSVIPRGLRRPWRGHGIQEGLQGRPWPLWPWPQPPGTGQVRTWGAGLPFDKLPPPATVTDSPFVSQVLPWRTFAWNQTPSKTPPPASNWEPSLWGKGHWATSEFRVQALSCP